jgi:hypothetical protein
VVEPLCKAGDSKPSTAINEGRKERSKEGKKKEVEI